MSRTIRIVLFGLIYCLIDVASVHAQVASEVWRLYFQDKESGKMIEDVIVNMYASDSTMVGYAFSDKHGAVRITPNPKVSYFTIRKMGYRSEVVSLRSARDHETVFMTPKETALPGVTVMRSPIKMSNDTLTYDALAFVRPDDDTLRDILKRLPGITMSENGMVKYQGEPIKRFYIEGMDLLGNRYNQATNNLSAKAISKVEVLERHQDIKMLRGKVFESKASLNIKLKENYKSRPFGYTEVGLDQKFAHYMGHLNLTQVGQKGVQYFVDIKGNNIGTLYESEGQVLNIGRDPITFLMNPSDVVSTQLQGKISLPDESYIRNTGGLASGNVLIKVGNEATLRLNATALGEKCGILSHQKDNYLTEPPVVIDEEYSSWRRTRAIMPEVTYELNAGKVFLKDELSYRGEKTHLNSSIVNLSNVASDMKLEPQSQNQWVSNLLTGMLTMGSHFVNAHSVIRYTDQKGMLNFILPIVDVNPALAKNEWTARHKLSSQLRLSDVVKVNLGLRHDFLSQRYDEGIGAEGQSSFNYNRVTFAPEFIFTLLDKTLSISLGSTLGYSSAQVHSPSANSSALKIPTIEPELGLRYEFSPHHQINLHTGWSRDIRVSSDYFVHPVRFSHRLYKRNYMEPVAQSSWRSRLNWSYKDMLHYFFANAMLSASVHKEALVSDMSITQERTDIGYLVSPHTVRQFNAMANVDQSFLNVGLDFKLSGQFNLQDFYSSINGQLDSGVLQMSLVELKTVFNRFEWMTLENNTEYIRTESRRTAGNHSSETVMNTLGLNIVPSRKWSLTADYKVIAFPGASQRYPTMHLLGGSMKYKATPKLRLQGQFTNILGQSEYVVHSVNGLNENFSSTSLSPFRILMTLKYEFN